MAEPIPLVGREDVLQQLRDALAQAERRRGQLLVVSGEPGIGKSALADLVGRDAGERGATVVFGRAWELAEAPPYFPVWSGLRALGLEPPRGAALESDAFHLWERVLEALARLAAERPFVWILEDLHAADLLTLDLLTFLARPLRALGVLVLVTMRDRDPRIGEPAAARLARLCRDGLELRLGLLDADQGRALAEAIAGRPLPAPAVRQLLELTGGNPLFLIECARGYRQRAPGPLPPSIRALVGDRVALLPHSAREALASGAVVGRDFSAALVARMQGGLPAQVIERLGPALRAGILVELRPGQFRFSHILVRDAVEDALGTAGAAELHARAAQALTGDGVEVLVERARHALAALRPEGDPVGLALRAARALEEMGAADRALALYQRLEDAAAAGLETGRPTADEVLHRAALARAAGQHAEARRRCQVVLAQARAGHDAGLMGRAALEMGAELRPGIVDAELVAALREALAPGRGDPVLRCRLEARLAAALQPAEDPGVPMAMGRAAIAGARTLGDSALLLDVLHMAGSALVDYAPLDERLALAAELRDRAGDSGDLPRVLLAHARLAMDHAEVGDFAAFDADVTRLGELSAQLGHPRFRWRPLLFASMRAIPRGDFESSDRHVVEVQQQASLSDDPSLSTSLWAHLLNRAVQFHRDDEVRARLPRIAAAMEGVPEGSLWAACIRGAALARLGDEAGAALELARIRGRFTTLISDVRSMAAEMAALVGSGEERRSLRALVEPMAEREIVSGHVPVTYEGPWLRVLALLDSSLGDHERALARLDRCLAAARVRGHALWVVQLSYDRGRALAAAGRAREAAASLEEAAAGAEALGMTGLVGRVRAHLHATPTAPAAASAGETFRVTREGDVWRLEAGARTVRVRHSRGMELLARLVERPGEELHVLALASDAGGPLVEGDAGELLDAQARREYGARLLEIDAELAEAEAAHDLGRQARLQRERESLEGELSRAVGLGGRGRPAASATERARVNVQRRLKDAIARVSDVDGALGARLAAALHTGTYCCFRP
jgi:tetratricopeptide (TPR) repeat protein